MSSSKKHTLLLILMRHLFKNELKQDIFGTYIELLDKNGSIILTVQVMFILNTSKTTISFFALYSFCV